MGLRVVTIFCTDSTVSGEKFYRVPVVEGTEGITEFVARGGIDQVWIAMPFKDEDKVKNILYKLFIRYARHVPPSYESVRVAMPVFFDLISKEPAVRAVLGHFVFAYSHLTPQGASYEAGIILKSFLKPTSTESGMPNY